MIIIQNEHKELETLLKQSVIEFNSYVSSKRREITDIHHQIKQHHKIFKENDSRFYSIIKELSKIDKNLHVIQEINTISYHLLKQDEIDKKSMSLIGCKTTKENKKKSKGSKSPISLDKNCISCANNLAQVTSAFKIACLAYTSSPISYNNTTITRLELLEKLEKMIDNKGISIILENNDYEGLKYRSLTPELPKVRIHIR